jgi:hypothetical protein
MNTQSDRLTDPVKLFSVEGVVALWLWPPLEEENLHLFVPNEVAPCTLVHPAAL